MVDRAMLLPVDIHSLLSGWALERRELLTSGRRLKLKTRLENPKCLSSSLAIPLARMDAKSDQDGTHRKNMDEHCA